MGTGQEARCLWCDGKLIPGLNTDFCSLTCEQASEQAAEALAAYDRLNAAYAAAEANDVAQLTAYVASLNGKCEECGAEHLPGNPLCSACLDNWSPP